jgi:hypothetical protein
MAKNKTANETETVVIEPADVGQLKTDEAAPKSKSPLVDSLKAKLRAEKARLVALLAPVRKRLDELTQSDEVNKLRQQVRDINKEMMVVDNELAAMLRAGGSKSMKAEPGNYVAGK